MTLVLGVYLSGHCCGKLSSSSFKYTQSTKRVPSCFIFLTDNEHFLNSGLFTQIVFIIISHILSGWVFFWGGGNKTSESLNHKVLPKNVSKVIYFLSKMFVH